MKKEGSAEVIKHIDLGNKQKIYLKIYGDEINVIEVINGYNSRNREYFLWYTLINIECIDLQKLEVSQEDRYFYKGCVISFESERDEMTLTACIEGDIDVKNKYIEAGYADSGNDIVSKNIKKALEIAIKQIDEAILIDRDNLIKTMTLPKNIRSLSEEERNEIICETIIKVSRLLKAIKCDSSEYKLSQRQQATKNNAINKIKAKDFLEAYYEIVDFVDDYGDRHNGKVFEIEKQEINTLMAIIYNDIKQ